MDSEKIFEFQSMNMISNWYYNTPKNDECWICHRSINTNSLHHKELGEHSIIDKGECGHCFHRECIEKWTKKYNPKCVICNKQWKLSYSIDVHQS